MTQSFAHLMFSVSFSLIPFVLLALIVCKKKGPHSFTTAQLILLCLGCSVLSLVFSSLYNVVIKPHVIDVNMMQYELSNYFGQSVDISAYETVPVARPFVLYFILRKKYKKSSVDSFSQLPDDVKSAIQSADESADAKWYTVGEQIYNCDIIVNKLADPAIIRVKSKSDIRNAVIKKPRDYITTHPGDQVQLINCESVFTQENIQPVITSNIS